MSKIKAKFKLKLEANGAVIAESEDTELCLQVLNAISKQENIGTDKSQVFDKTDILPEEILGNKASDSIDAFAQKIGVKKEDLIGSCYPQEELPYLTLNPKYWESLKNNTGHRGKTAVSPTVLSLTLLNFWFDVLKNGKPKQKDATEVVRTLNITDKNPTRSIKNCDWLQKLPDKTIVINPAKISKAEALAKTFITQGKVE